ncbi:peptidase [Desulfuribacillus stibiiarsenatis]|uniref:Peptidase n=1 Tax=Desulfuribacillus stibiiarsenatis TaxID=1390249 RepID=A0A1E5L9Q9_9FIRM|nr:SPFH domain-containing protein [Desulfuribacillus stibiiarsenatis]OEH86871.1 peptidase [Desulfuribacillus stibiiarsenatis]
MEILLIVILVFIVITVSNVRIVPQAKSYVIERLGGYHSTWGVGIHIKIPLIDRIANKVSLKEQAIDFAPQPVITRDNVTMQIDTVIFFQITDPKAYTYGVDNPIRALENLSATTLRNIIGDMELDSTLTSRDTVNVKMRAILDDATNPWGIKINRVELKNIIPPQEIQKAMERQMKAERERREKIIQAEGEKMSLVLVAEGQRAAMILDAEGKKLSMILDAEGKKEAAIREAEGEAQAILTVQEATAKGLQMIKNVQADESLLRLKSLETFAAVADGQATKIIIPSEIQNMAGLLTSLTEVAKDKK